MKRFKIAALLTLTTGCINRSPASEDAKVQTINANLSAGSLPKISINCKEFDINPVFGQGGRVVSYRLKQHTKNEYSGSLRSFVERVEFRKITHDLGNGVYAQNFSFKAPGQAPNPRINLAFSINAGRRLAIEYTLVEGNNHGREESTKLQCTMFYEPNEGSKVRAVEIQPHQVSMAFKVLSDDLLVGETLWQQSTLTFTSPRDFSRSASDRVLVLQDASGMPIGVLEDSVKAGPGGMRILAPLIIRRFPKCSPEGAPPKVIVHGFKEASQE